MNKTEFVDLKFFYNIYSLHFSVGRVSMIEALLKKRSKVSMRSKVRGFDGSNKNDSLAPYRTQSGHDNVALDVGFHVGRDVQVHVPNLLNQHLVRDVFHVVEGELVIFVARWVVCELVRPLLPRVRRHQMVCVDFFAVVQQQCET